MVTILIVESDSTYATQLTKKIHELKESHVVFHAHSLQEAFSHLQNKKIALIITNLFLSDSEGIRTVTKLHEVATMIPIVICGKKIDESLAEAAIHSGAQDWIDLPKSTNELLQRQIRYSIERKYLIENLRALSFTDELTGLYNRRGFITLATQQIEISLRTMQGFVLYVMDVDYFKQINDQYGHQMGDQALIEVAQLMRKSFRHYDIIGRIGGDEFAVIALNIPEDMEKKLKEKMELLIEERNKNTLELPAFPYVLSVSIGSVYYRPTTDILAFEDLFRLADEALYQVKQNRRFSQL